MILVDTHAHLYLDDFEEDREQVIRNAADNDVGYILLPNIDKGTVTPMLSLADAHPDICIPMMGLHPTSVKKDYREQLSEVEKWLSERSFCAVGEIGIDLYWDKTHLKEQETAFREQVRLAQQLDLPVVIHSRNSFKEIIDILKDESQDTLRGVFHCFTGDLDEAYQAINLGFTLGIGGIITYKKSGFADVIEHIDLKHLVLETDAPFLPPVPHRGERNQSAWIMFVAQRLAQLKGISVEEAAEATTENAKKLFRLT